MKLKSIIAICIVWIGSCAAHAQTAGDFLLSAGWAHFAPQDQSGSVEGGESLAMRKVNRAPVFGLDGSGISVSRTNSAALSASYFITDHWASEFMLGISPELDLYGAGKWSAMGKLGTVRQWSPALLLKYYFLDETSKWRPYAGIGVSRAWFTDAYFDNALYEGSFGEAATMSVSAKNTWNAVFNAGLHYQFQKHWFAGLSVYYMPLRAIVTLNTHFDSGAGDSLASYQDPIRISPIITFLQIGYRF